MLIKQVRYHGNDVNVVFVMLKTLSWQALENCRICDDVEAYDAAEMLARGSGQGVAGTRVPAFSHIYRVEKVSFPIVFF